MNNIRKITLSVSIFFFFSLIILPPQTKACSCIFSGGFCESISSISDHVSLVVIMDSLDWDKRSAVVVENIQNELSSETIVLKGGSGGSCEVEMQRFNIGDTLLVGLNANDDVEYSLYSCGVYFLKYKNGILQGNVLDGAELVEYEEFKVNFADCLATSGVRAQLERSLSVFPSPSSTVINIALSASPFNVVELYDITGKLIIKELAINDTEAQINVSDLPNGIYLLRVFVGELFVTRKIMVI